MAAADDRGALNAGEAAAPGPPPGLWLAAIGAGLAAVLVAVALVQGRQAQLLTRSVVAGEDNASTLVTKVEVEYLRLREAWTLAASAAPDPAGTAPQRPAAAPAAADAAARQRLQLRYDVWVSRVGLVHADLLGGRLLHGEEARQALQAAQAFIARADRLLGPGADGRPLPAAALRELLPLLQALDAPLRGLVLQATQASAEQVTERDAGVRQHHRIGIALTLFLSALTLAFAVLAMRQTRQLDQRRRALEELAARLRTARHDAEAASEAKSVFLANMSHEIRTPFHGLMGMLSLLRETGLDARQRDLLRTATESADHLLALLNDILDMSQLESGRLALVPAPVDLRTLLHEVEALMRPQAHARRLALHIDTDPAVPERVMADATRVKQVVFNLVSNAIKFSEHGLVLVELRVEGGPSRRGEAAGDEARRLAFHVTDTGVGMDEATLAQLFRRFVQGDGSRSRRHGGTGLGLEISRNLARLMGGDITVQSRPGQGSCFVFALPLQPVAPSAGLAGVEPAEGRPAGARRLHVLVAEDHPVNRQYLAALLDTMGHDAHFAADGRQAVAALQEQAALGRRFDIVLMDLHMPELDGIGATRAIRALPDAALSTVPIVALTADAFGETRERCLVAGMNDFLTKPVSPQKLATSLRRLFGSGGGVAPGGAEAGESPLPASAAHPAADAAHGQPLLDAAALERALQGLPRERLAHLVHDFLDQVPQTAARLRAAVRDAEALALRTNAHAVRGAALNLGLGALAATAEALQEGAAHLPAHEIARLVQRFEDLLPPTRAAALAAGLAPPRQPAQEPA